MTAILIAAFLTLAVTAAMPITPVRAQATEVWVDAVNGDDANPGTEAKPFATIQKGIDTVAEGGTVHVKAGTYIESIVVDRSITLQSTSGADVTIIEGPTPLNPDTTYNTVVEITANDVVFDGFTITAQTQARHGVLVDNTAENAILKNLIVTGIRANPNWDDPQGYAITVSGPGSQILDTTAKNNDHGFGVSGDNAFLKNIVAEGNGHGDHGGYDLWIGAADVEVDTFSAESGWADGCGPNVYITGSAKDTIIRGLTSHSETYCGIQILGGFSGGGGTFKIIDCSFSNKRAAGAHAGWYPAYGILECCNPGAGYGCDFNVEITNTDFTDNDVGIGIGSAFSGYRPQSGTVEISGCTFTGNDKGVWRHSGTADNGGAVTINFNNIYDNTEFGVHNELDVLDATNNWWGHASGPYHPTLNPDGLGDTVSDNVDFDPWLTAPITAVHEETTSPGADTVHARAEADAEVIKSGTGTPTVTVAKYTSNPGTGFAGDIGKYIDVHISTTTDVDEIEIRLYYTDAEVAGLVESSLVMYWWDGAAWVACSDTGVNVDENYIWARIRADTTPSLADLAGAPFGGRGSPPPPVGGLVFPVDKLALLAPYVAAMLAIAAGAVVIRRRRY